MNLFLSIFGRSPPFYLFEVKWNRENPEQYEEVK